MIPIEALGWTLLGAGVTIVTLVFIQTMLRIRGIKHTKLHDFVESVKREGEKLINSQSQKEISEFSFRDREGKLATVKIVVDHGIRGGSIDPTEIQGTLEEIVASSTVTKAPMQQVQEFVFSPNAIREMREAGMEPDEVVVRMLKASGRMP